MNNCDQIALNLIFLKETEKLLLETSNSGIPIIILKGIALVTILQNQLNRPVSDIDIMIHKQDLHKVKDILHKLGYFPVKPNFEKSENKDLTIPYKNNRGILIEIHTELINVERYRILTIIDNKKIWEDLRNIKIQNQYGYILASHFFLIHLCLHVAIQHGLRGFQWFTDIHNFIEYENDRIDWLKVEKYSKEFRIEKPVYYALWITKQFHNISIPDFLLSQWEIKYPSKILKKIFLENYFLNYQTMEFTIPFFLTENLFDKIKMVFYKQKPYKIFKFCLKGILGIIFLLKKYSLKALKN